MSERPDFRLDKSELRSQDEFGEYGSEDLEYYVDVRGTFDKLPLCADDDSLAASGADESRRKTRTLAGNYQIIGLEPRLLIPFINPIWVQYVSHKIGRLFVPWCLAIALVVNVPLAFQSWLYRLALMVQLCFYGLAFVGARSAHQRGGHAMDESRRASERRPGSVRERRLSL